jgi:hypothetical protein
MPSLPAHGMPPARPWIGRLVLPLGYPGLKLRRARTYFIYTAVAATSRRRACCWLAQVSLLQLCRWPHSGHRGAIYCGDPGHTSRARSPGLGQVGCGQRHGTAATPHLTLLRAATRNSSNTPPCRSCTGLLPGGYAIPAVICCAHGVACCALRQGRLPSYVAKLGRHLQRLGADAKAWMSAERCTS